MSFENPIDKRKKDLLFRQAVVCNGGPRSIYEGQKFGPTFRRYPLEFWYICREINPQYFNLRLRIETEKTIEK